MRLKKLEETEWFMNFHKYLQDKPLFYRVIDRQRMPRTYESVKDYFKHGKIVHVVGTNGKGSSGRFLALMLKSAGKSVGHYTSPHLLEFNERIWINGENISDEKLQELHVELQKILPNADELSYFEYTTFLAMLAFRECEYIILEAGLGGESDATNVFEKDVIIFTPIGYDHTDFLGETLEQIATSKLNAMQKFAILNPNQEPIVKEIAIKIAKKKEIPLVFADELVDEDSKFDEYIAKNSYPKFLKQNLLTAYAGARVLGIHVELEKLPRLDLRARHEKLGENILLDCGHNEMAAKLLFDSLSDKKYTFIYNSFADKDVGSILEILAPKMERVMVIEIDDPQRTSAEDEIKEILKIKNIPYGEYEPIFEEDSDYVVFGSFHVVQKFLESLNA